MARNNNTKFKTFFKGQMQQILCIKYIEERKVVRLRHNYDVTVVKQKHIG